MFMDICNPSENSFSKIFRIAEMWFLLISNLLAQGRLKADAFLENLTFTTFLSPFINTVLSFSNTMGILSVAR